MHRIADVGHRHVAKLRDHTRLDLALAPQNPEPDHRLVSRCMVVTDRFA
jgi:hypothetical protein